MSSTEEVLKTIRHDVKGTCAQLTAALPLLEKLLIEGDPEAREIIKEMADTAARLSERMRSCHEHA